jgi:cyanate permease
MSEVLVRFFLGGMVVSAFALLSDVLRPKSFAGLVGAVPSVALATLGMAVVQLVRRIGQRVAQPRAR